MKICRFCKNYRPDIRYKGVIGWCEAKDKPMELRNACNFFEEGKQMWLQGVEVEE